MATLKQKKAVAAMLQRLLSPQQAVERWSMGDPDKDGWCHANHPDGFFGHYCTRPAGHTGFHVDHNPTLKSLVEETYVLIWPEPDDSH